MWESVCERIVQMQMLADGFHPQRDDKVALFKVLRENLERVKAGTLDTGSMRAIRLRADSRTLPPSI